MTSEISEQPDATNAQLMIPRPEPRCAISIRQAVPDDLPFLDSLQKMHSHMVGWFPKKQMESYIEGGNVLVAEDDKVTRGQGDKVPEADGTGRTRRPSDSPCHPFTPSPCHPPSPLGYCIGKDRYMGRDDVGIMYQVNVLPLKQRHLIGAMLVKACLERAAYGCRLFSLWCAQDLQANWFWESLGFVPLAFRTGSRGKQRIHIFWQRTVREGDDGPNATRHWFPSQTRAGAVREDRLVFPIPPGTHWRDVKPVILPPPEVLAEEETKPQLPDTLPGGAPVKGRPVDSLPEKPRESAARKMAVVRSRSRHLQGLPAGKAAVMSAGGIRYVERGDYEPPEAPPEVEAPKPRKKRASKPRAKHDPKHIAQARELRDRFLEEVATGRFLPGEGCEAKYDVSRRPELGFTAEGAENTEVERMGLLGATRKSDMMAA